jgi:hypothetical protein
LSFLKEPPEEIKKIEKLSPEEALEKFINGEKLPLLYLLKKNGKKEIIIEVLKKKYNLPCKLYKRAI